MKIIDKIDVIVSSKRKTCSLDAQLCIVTEDPGLIPGA